MSAWERGASVPNVVELRQLVTFYGVSADYVLFGLTSQRLGQAFRQMFCRGAAGDTVEDRLES